MKYCTTTYKEKRGTEKFFSFTGKETIEERGFYDFLYEKDNHLGNVMVVVSDRKLPVDVAPADGVVDYYTADVLQAQDYDPYGMLMPGRNFNAGDYRFGFNGQEKDDEITGKSGSHYTAQFWEYDARLGRRWNRDPLTNSGESPYATFAGNPIFYSDPSGLTPGNGIKEVIRKVKEFIKHPFDKSKRAKYLKSAPSTSSKVPDPPSSSGDAPQTNTPSENKGGIELNFGATTTPTVFSSNQSVEYHTTSPFSSSFPYIKPDEPASQISIMYKFPNKGDGRFSYSIGLFDYHTKPNQLGSGLYLGNGYTQLGPGFSVYYNTVTPRNLSIVATAGIGPMFSDPEFREGAGKTYMPYANLTPFLPNSYQLTGFGATILVSVDYRFTSWLSLYAAYTIHGDVSRALRASDGTAESLNTLSGAAVGGIKVTIR